MFRMGKSLGTKGQLKQKFPQQCSSTFVKPTNNQFAQRNTVGVVGADGLRFSAFFGTVSRFSALKRTVLRLSPMVDGSRFQAFLGTVSRFSSLLSDFQISLQLYKLCVWKKCGTHAQCEAFYLRFLKFQFSNTRTISRRAPVFAIESRSKSHQARENGRFHYYFMVMASTSSSGTSCVINCVIFYYEAGKTREDFRKKDKCRCIVLHEEKCLINLRNTVW